MNGTSRDQDARKLRVLSREEFETDEVPPPIVEGFLYERSTTNLAGASKAGKSVLAAQLGMAVTAGKPFLGLETRKANVLVICLEMSAGLYRDRMQAIAADTGTPMSTVGEGFDVVAPTREHIPTINMGMDEGPEAIAQIVRECGSELVILDTLYRFIPGLDPNSNADMGEVYGRLNTLAQSTGVALLILDHIAKGDFDGPVSLSALGAGVKGGAANTIGKLKRTTRQGGGRWQLEVESHYCEWEEPLFYRRPTQGSGEWGKGCVFCSASESRAINLDTIKHVFQKHADQDGDRRPCFVSQRRLIQALESEGLCSGNSQGEAIVAAIKQDFALPEKVATLFGDTRPIGLRDGPRRSTIFTWRAAL